MSVIMTAFSTQQSIDQSYIESLPFLPADVDAEISAAVGHYNLPELETAKFEKKRCGQPDITKCC
ncbi:hypothetical protein TOC8171_22230 [Pseudomonas syringae]